MLTLKYRFLLFNFISKFYAYHFFFLSNIIIHENKGKRKKNRILRDFEGKTILFTTRLVQKRKEQKGSQQQVSLLICNIFF